MCSVKYRKSSKRYRIGIKINLAFISEHHVLTSEYYSASCICLHADISDLFPYSVKCLFIYFTKTTELFNVTCLKTLFHGLIVLFFV